MIPDQIDFQGITAEEQSQRTQSAFQRSNSLYIFIRDAGNEGFQAVVLQRCVCRNLKKFLSSKRIRLTPFSTQLRSACQL